MTAVARPLLSPSGMLLENLRPKHLLLALCIGAAAGACSVDAGDPDDDDGAEDDDDDGGDDVDIDVCHEECNDAHIDCSGSCDDEDDSCVGSCDADFDDCENDC
jgi:hypothetical protein